ncbi:uncharacterized protein LOC135376257 [Ornithodoros turicata]|uniref:uncharacterized protein LOC135376257 n=1 Tax=Ornithodoros turicata TaxID=34597 RepID=UPI0031387776
MPPPSMPRGKRQRTTARRDAADLAPWTPTPAAAQGDTDSDQTAQDPAHHVPPCPPPTQLACQPTPGTLGAVDTELAPDLVANTMSTSTASSTPPEPGPDPCGPLQSQPGVPIHHQEGPVFTSSVRTPTLGTQQNAQPRGPLHHEQEPAFTSSVRTPAPDTQEELELSAADDVCLDETSDVQPTRDGSTLTVYFPLPDHFSCCEDDCSVSYRSAVWTSQRSSLTRHLERAHNIRIQRTQYLCSDCGQSLNARPTSHECSPASRQASPQERRKYAHNCEVCGDTFPTRRGLDNHLIKHRRDQARAARVNQCRNSDAGTTATNTHYDETPGTEAPQVPTTQENSTALNGLTQLNSTALSELNYTQDVTVMENDAPHSHEGGEAGHSSVSVSTIALSATPEDDASHDGPTASAELADSALNCSGPPTGTPIPTRQSPHTETDDIPEDLLQEFVSEVKKHLDSAKSDSSWASFEETLVDATEAVAAAVKIRNTPRQDKPRRQINPDNPRCIQRLYKRNRRQAVRLITQGNQERCPISDEELTDHFRHVWEEKHADTELLCSRTPAKEEINSEPFSPEEVRARLRRCESTAPGSDQLTYAHWKAVDPGCYFLSAVFNVCLLYRRVPSSWRATTTVLIYKKGDRQDPSNWRPISLGRTIAKLYAGCWASRLQCWIQDEDVLSKCQKGFLPHDGVFEHNFVLQERFDNARSGGKELCVAMLDYTNAFGSVPHNALVDAVKGAGTGATFVEIIQDIYSENTTTVLSSNGCTEPIPTQAGIRQGCPLSGLLFNLVVDPIIRRIQGEGKEHRILAYADDITALAPDPTTLQTCINLIESMSTKLGLQLNPRKCKTLHLSGRRPVGLRDTTFTVLGEPIPALEEFASHPFLGKPVGFNILPEGSTVSDAIATGQKILNSMLSPWQRLDAVKTFVFPALNFEMRLGTLGKTEWQKLDNALRPLLKKTLYLPTGATNDYLYGSKNSGACAIPLAAELSDLSRIDSAFKLLTSKDEELKILAWNALETTTEGRLRRKATERDVEDFLSGENEGEFRAPASGLRNIWTEARKASRRLQVTWEFTDKEPCLTCGSSSITALQRRRVIATLRKELSTRRDESLKSLPNQGKVMECVAADPSSSHFIRGGTYTRFSDWRFIHKARLNLLPLNGARPWQSGGDTRCRRCGYARETLPHVVCHCMRQSAAMTGRHNRVVDRIKKAASGRYTIMAENQPIGGTALRPDLVLQKGEEAIIVDVCCPFENRIPALLEARKEKERKYQTVKENLQRRFQRVTIEAVVVGALGSWDPRNDRLLKKLCSKTYAKKLKKLCVSDVIAASRDIYAAHITTNSNR